VTEIDAAIALLAEQFPKCFAVYEQRVLNTKLTADDQETMAVLAKVLGHFFTCHPKVGASSFAVTTKMGGC
jgi:hypothetical protein